MSESPEIIDSETASRSFTAETPREIAWLNKIRDRTARAMLQTSSNSLAQEVRKGEDGHWRLIDPVPANEMPVLLAVWCALDPPVARDLLENWLTEQLPDGTFLNIPGQSTPCWPIVAQCVDLVLDIFPDPEFKTRVVPKLDAYLLACFRHYDRKGQVLPRWPSAEESIFPHLFSPDIITVDLAVLLLNELKIFVELLEGMPEYDTLRDNYRQEIEELTTFLVEIFWNQEKQEFRIFSDNTGLQDGPLEISIFSLVWMSAPPQIDEGLQSLCRAVGKTMPNIHVEGLFYTLLIRSPHNSIIRMIRNHFLAQFPHGEENLEGSASDREEVAAMMILVHGADYIREKWMKNIPKMVRWADGHGMRILTVGIFSFLVLLVIGGLWYEKKRREGVLMQKTKEYEARRLSQDGEHEEALAIYQTFQPMRGYNRLVVANEKIYLKRYEEAEADYRKAISEMGEYPKIYLNLALSIYLQGRKEDAMDLYLEIDEAYRYRYPEVSRQAATAADLIRDQISLDQTE